jgi:hypothetical protein
LFCFFFFLSKATPKLRGQRFSGHHKNTQTMR